MTAEILALFPADAIMVEHIVSRKEFASGGPWENEPDRIQWRDPKTNQMCLIRRNHYGALCGYVGVGSDHPWYNHAYDSIDAKVHGGLTYGEHCDEDPIKGICHVPKIGEADHMFWLGFDCGHSSDFIPDSRFNSFSKGKYRSMQYVRDECAKLALQASYAKGFNLDEI